MTKASSVHKLKIIFTGPSGTGKTSLANFIADATEISEEYRPTAGVRILEFETPNLNVQNRSIKAEIELWDCSGNRSYEPCWAALRQGAHGVALVADLSQGTHSEVARQLETYYDYFVQQSGLNPTCCLVLITSRQNPPLNRAPPLLSNNRVQHVVADIEEGSNKLRADFSLFLANVLNNRTSSERDDIGISISYN